MDRDHEMMEEQPGGRWARRGVGRYVRWAVVSVVLLVVGAAAGMVWSERRAVVDGQVRIAGSTRATNGGSMPGMPGMSAPAGPGAAVKTDEPVEVSLTPEAIERAGIKIA